MQNVLHNTFDLCRISIIMYAVLKCLASVLMAAVLARKSGPFSPISPGAIARHIRHQSSSVAGDQP